MSDNNQKVVIGSQGIEFCGLLFIILLLLKVGVVETVAMGWSWWWITSPLWAPMCLVFGITAITLIVILCGLVITEIVTAVKNHNKIKVEKINHNKE